MSGNSAYVSMYPKLDRKTLKDSKMNVHYEADYDTLDGNMKLEVHEGSGISFDDPNGIWSIEDYGINLRIIVEIEKPLNLLQCSLQGMVDSISFAARIKSRDSLQRMVFNSCIVVDRSSDSIHGRIDVLIPPGTFRSSASLEVFAYLLKATEGTDIPRGVILGTIDEDNVMFSGNGTDFPITTVISDENFLWRLDFYDDSEPGRVSFCDAFALIFNEKHPSFKKLDLDKSPFDSPLFQEILAESVSILVSHVEKLEGCGNKDEPCESGSLSDAVHYMLDSYVQHVDDINRRSQNIHDFIWKGGL